MQFYGLTPRGAFDLLLINAYCERHASVPYQCMKHLTVQIQGKTLTLSTMSNGYRSRAPPDSLSIAKFET